MTTSTTRKVIRYGALVARLMVWTALSKVGCLLSSECRRVVAEANSSPQGCIDPLVSVLDQLDRLHVDLFGDEHAD
jgi:hypothetical protein